MSVFEITFLSVKRRMPQIIKAACTTLAAVFFVTAVLIFQDNMYQWQMSSNKSRFGDWFLYEVTSEEPNKSLSEHAYLNDLILTGKGRDILSEALIRISLIRSESVLMKEDFQKMMTR